MGAHRKGLQRFLDDPRVPLDNNATERALRGPVQGRKNHYGSRSRRGSEVAALFYTLVGSAPLNGVEPREYLRTATLTALTNKTVPLPHEIVAKAATSRAGSHLRPAVTTGVGEEILLPDPVQCSATPGAPVAEVCGDTIDNDCDGVVDNGC